MFRDRLDADRFFARIRELDLECPACAAVFVIHRQTTSNLFNRRTGLFHCPNCDLVLALGVIAYPVTTARHQSPPDWVPTPRQSLAMRGALAGQYAASTERIGWKVPHNVVMRPECTCQLEGHALLVSPSCPLHSIAAARAQKP